MRRGAGRAHTSAREHEESVRNVYLRVIGETIDAARVTLAPGKGADGDSGGVGVKPKAL